MMQTFEEWCVDANMDIQVKYNESHVKSARRAWEAALSQREPCSHRHSILQLLANSEPHPTEVGKSIVPNWTLNMVGKSIEPMGAGKGVTGEQPDAPAPAKTIDAEELVLF